MLIETSAGRHNRLTEVEPHLMVPQRIVDGQSQIAVQSRPIFPPRDVVPLGMQEPYISVPLDEVKRIVPLRTPRLPNLILPTGQEVPILPEKQEKVEFPTFETTESGFVLMTGVDLTSEDDIARGTVRRVQRMEQYRRVMNFANYWEVNLDEGRYTSEDVRVIAPLVRRLQRIGIHRYMDEFATDVFTHDLVNNMNIKLEQEKKEALEGKPKPVMRREKQQGESIYDSVGMRSGQRTEDVLREEQEQQQEYEMHQAAEEFLLQIKALNEEQENEKNLDQGKKIRESGTLYVHDPEQDEPSEEAAEWVRELWERPF